MHFIKPLFLLILLLLSVSAFATGTGPYLGVQVGSTNLNNQTYAVNTGIPLPPATVCDPNNIDGTCIVVPTEPSNTGIGERLFFGVQMNRFAGFELGLTNYGPSTYSPDVAGDSNEPTIRVYSVDILAKGMYSLYNFTLFGKVGGAGTRETASAALIGAPEDVLKGLTSGHFMAAFGISWDINPNWVVDLGVSRIFKGHDFPNADFYGIGLSYHWVDLYCGQFLCD